MKKQLLALAAVAALGLAGSARADIIINEIDSDSVNEPTTDHYEFIELYSTTGTTTSLDGLRLVLFNGNGDVSYGSISLSGLTTDANGYYVFGTTSVPGADNTTFLNNPANAGGAPGNFLQNGADAVALYRTTALFPNGTPLTTTDLIDAIVYDTADADDTGLLQGLGETVQYDEAGAGNGPGHALARVPDATGEFVAQAPTPDGPNAIPEPAGLALLGVAAITGLTRRRRA